MSTSQTPRHSAKGHHCHHFFMTDSKKTMNIKYTSTQVVGLKDRQFLNVVSSRRKSTPPTKVKVNY